MTAHFCIFGPSSNPLGPFTLIQDRPFKTGPFESLKSAEGDLKDIFSIPNGDLTGIDLDLYLDDFQEDEKFLFFTDSVFELR